MKITGLNPFEIRASFESTSRSTATRAGVLIPLKSGLHLNKAAARKPSQDASLNPFEIRASFESMNDGRVVGFAGVLIPLKSGLHLNAVEGK